MQIENKKTTNYPGVSNLVDAVYTTELHQFIDKYNTNLDKHTILMFLAMIFVVLLQLHPSSSYEERKQLVKQIVSEYIRDPDKRSAIINYFSKTTHFLSN